MSVDYGEAVLEKIYTTFDYGSHVSVTFLENHFQQDYQPSLQGPVEVRGVAGGIGCDCRSF